VGSFVRYGRVDAWGTLARLGATAPVAAPAPTPRSEAPPVLLVWPGNALTSAPQPGQVLAASSGGWTGVVPMSFTWTWSRCSNSDSCTTVASSTASTYTVATADSGYALRATLTASNGSGPASASSALSAAVGGAVTPPAAPTLVSAPLVSGLAQEGQTLTVSTGTWNGSPTAYAYQWVRCDSSGSGCVPIASGTGAGYAATSADVGSTLRADVTASSGAGSTTASSSTTALVAAAPISPTTTKTTTYSGSLTAKRGSQRFDLTLPAGAVAAIVNASKCTQIGLALQTTSGGAVSSSTGTTSASLSTTVSGGSYAMVVSGTPSKGTCTFTLTVKTGYV
jgi:hypothetical protein